MTGYQSNTAAHASTRRALDGNFAGMHALSSKLAWVRKLRPQVLAEPFYRLLGGDHRRFIVPWGGVRIYTSPLSHFGGALLTTGHYEPQDEWLLQTYLKANDTFLDIGANEGVYTALASSIVGDGGHIIAVEPQSRLGDLVEINARLNSSARLDLVQKVIAEEDGERFELSLTPTSNTGASGLVNRYRWSQAIEGVDSVRLDSLLRDLAIEHVALAKIDVEGFEPEVLRSGREVLEAGKIDTLAVDYHAAILQDRGLNPRDSDAFVRSCGYDLLDGNPETGGYVVYGKASNDAA